MFSVNGVIYQISWTKHNMHCCVSIATIVT